MVTEKSFGRYRLEHLLGQGGMGEVHRAFDTVRGRRVALKLLLPALGSDPEYVARFRSEAAIAARLTDPHIVPVHDFGEIDGRLFIDMRLVEGDDLAVLLRRDGRLPAERAVDIVGQIGSALDAAHAQGLVHRDIKPANVLLADGFAYVADFGIARPLGGAVSLTMTGVMLGSPVYMAPERFTAGRGDHRADVYALGCLLFETLTGRAPFTADEPLAIMYAHASTPPPRPSELVVGLPAGLDDVVARAMAKDPDDRFPSAGELAAAARQAIDSPALPTAQALPTPQAAPAVEPETTAEPIPRRRRLARTGPVLNRRLAIAAAVITVLFTAAGSTLTASRSEAAEVVLEARHSPGVNPFMPSVGTDSDDIQPVADIGGSVAGGEPGLYGGRSDGASCDTDSMISFLQTHPDQGAAWAGAQGIGVAAIPDYVGGLTPVALRTDTAVTNHGFRGGHANPFQAVLQSGTAVLVDQFGVPRAKCSCGNPLLPPLPLAEQSSYTGPAWPGFSPRKVTAVRPAATPVRLFRLVDLRTGLSFTRAPKAKDNDHKERSNTPDTRTGEADPGPTGTIVPAPAPESPFAGDPIDPSGTNPPDLVGSVVTDEPLAPGTDESVPTDLPGDPGPAVDASEPEQPDPEPTVDEENDGNSGDDGDNGGDDEQDGGDDDGDADALGLGPAVSWRAQ